MKILQIIQKRQFRGAEVFAAQVSTHMVESGHKVLVVVLMEGKANLPFNGKIISLEANLKKRFFDWKSWKKLANIIKDFKPDIVQANAGDTIKYALFSKKIFRWKQPVIYRNASMVSSYANNRTAKIIPSLLFKSADHIVSVSKYTKDDLVKYFSIDAGKITVLPVGIELKKNERVPEFDDKLINLVHIGGFSFEKNHERLLHMFKALHATDNRFRLWLVGDGGLYDKMKSLAKELAISEYVYFKGFVSNPMDYIYSGQALLLPSIIEGLPAVILEAFYCRTPVVAYEVGGIGLILQNNKTGWPVEAGNEHNFVESVLSISRSAKSEIEMITEQAYGEVLQNYSNIKIADLFIDLYKKVIKQANHLGPKD